MNTNALLQKYGSWEKDTTLQSSFHSKTLRNKEFYLQQWAWNTSQWCEQSEIHSTVQMGE